MKIDRKFLIFIGISVLTISNANAGQVSCHPGCFCLGDGTYNNELPDVEYFCGTYSATSRDPEGCGGSIYGDITVVSSSSCASMPATYYLDQFSEYYEGRFGFYGFINGEFVYAYQQCNAYGSSCSGAYDIFQCPYTHPHSASGASKLADCFKYDANGNKVYYGSGQTITCAPGKYLPANATQCSNCSTSYNQICPGGTFEKKNEIQGLKVNCFPGEYLPKGAKKCSTCNTNNYLCMGGVYDYDATRDQGRFQIDGYIASGTHTFTTCQPGYHMPANSTQCSACMGDYACPGGVFYTDATYNVPRGAILCAYGHANTTNTACVSDSSLPSYMLTKVEAAQQQQPAMASQQPSSPTGPGQQTVKKNQQRLSTVQVTSVSTTGTDNTQTEQNNQDPQLETAKKLISSGVAVPVDLTTPAPSATSSTSTTNVDNTQSFIPPKTGIKRGATRFR